MPGEGDAGPLSDVNDTAAKGVLFPFCPTMAFFFLLPYFLDAFNLAIYSQSMIGNRSFYIAVCAFSDQN